MQLWPFSSVIILLHALIDKKTYLRPIHWHCQYRRDDTLDVSLGFCGCFDIMSLAMSLARSFVRIFCTCKTASPVSRHSSTGVLKHTFYFLVFSQIDAGRMKSFRGPYRSAGRMFGTPALSYSRASWDIENHSGETYFS